MNRTIDFYFTVGSRYSYLAASQADRLEQETGWAVRWRPLYNQDLMNARARNPFSGPPPSAQYDPAFRIADCRRWAALYGIPYREPDWRRTDFRRLTLALVAADGMGGGAELARGMFRAVYGEGATLAGEDDLAALAREADLPAEALLAATADPATEAAHRRILAEAAAAGAFGVPTFVADGEAFWGNDRLPLLRHFCFRARMT
jgi:2-hydroxychromene-2-carboxylate isomerase